MDRRQSSNVEAAASAATSDVCAYLEQNCPPLFDEFTMLTALFEDARLRFAPKQQLAVSTATATAISAAEGRKKTQQQQQQQQSTAAAAAASSSPSAPAAAAIATTASSLEDSAVVIHVPLRTVEGDGMSTLARVDLSITLQEPKLFPAGEIQIQLKSMQIAPQLRADIAAQLVQYASELQQADSLTIAALAARTEEMLLGLPIAVQSSTFGCCLACNRQRLKSGLEKVPQPLRAATDQATGALTKVACLMCGSELVVIIPSLAPTKRTECSFCMCDDFPLISFRESGCPCVSCFDCFTRFAEIAVGSKQIYRRVGGFRGAGVTCPSHKGSVLSDPGLLKLLPARTLQRFQYFALKDLASPKFFNGFSCANPACGGGLQIQNLQEHGLALCIFCERATCLQCGNDSVRCTCKQLHNPTDVSVNGSNEVFVNRLFKKEFSERIEPEICACEEGDVMFYINGCKSQVIVRALPLRKNTWPAFVEAHVWQVELYAERKRAGNDWLAVFNGAPLRRDLPLCAAGVYPGAVVFIVPVVYLPISRLAEELELWRFRRQLAEQGAEGQEKQTGAYMLKTVRPCPGCGAPHSHPRGHHCHHMNIGKVCCSYEFCFNCLSPWPCRSEPKCPLFCNEKCKCELCEECKPGMPCNLCQGCDRCKIKDGNEAFS